MFRQCRVLAILLFSCIALHAQTLPTALMSCGGTGDTAACSAVNITANAFTKVALNTVYVDTANTWSATNNVWTAPSTGTYLVTTKTRIKDASTLNTQFGSGVAINGANVDSSSFVWAGISAYRQSVLDTRVITLTSGQTLNLFVFCDTRCTISSASLNIQQIPTSTSTASGASDPTMQILADGSHHYWSVGGAYPADHTYFAGGNGGAVYGRNINANCFGQTWNHGSWEGGFTTHNCTGLQLVSGSSASEIGQGIGLSFQHYGYTGDSAPFYIYDNYMPGTATAGSDEGHAGIRLGSNPSNTFKAQVSTDAGNVTGATTLRFSNQQGCGGTGSSYGISTCLGGGGWMMDKSDPIYTNYHMTAISGATNTSPMQLTVTENLTPGVFITSTATLGISDTYNGDTVSIPVTLPSGFTDPHTGFACVSGPSENAVESMGYTLSGTTLTLTGHHHSHGANGGNLTIGLQDCTATVFTQDTADNQLGSTAYATLGAKDAHTLIISASSNGSRTNGTLTRNKSIKADGSSLSAFNVYPAAMVLDVTDPNYTVSETFSPTGIYSYGPLYAHVGTNSVPWASGKTVEEGYNSADTYYLDRTICNTPLADTDQGSNCRYTEVRGSTQRVDEIVLTNSVDIASRRGRPNIFFIRPYNYSNTTGTFSNFAYANITPTDGWLVSSYACGESLFDPTGCPDHMLWQEGQIGYIKISGKTKTMTFTMGALDYASHFSFQQGVTALSLHATNGFSGTCSTAKVTVVDGIITGCTP